MPIGEERAAIQRPFVRYAVEAGWTYLTPDDALGLREALDVLFKGLLHHLMTGKLRLPGFSGAKV
jgi:type I restriction enzyme R subunit